MDEPATGEKLEQSCVIPLGLAGFPELPSAPLSESFLWPNSHASSDYETASTSLAQGDSPKSTPRCDDWADSSPSSALDPVSSASCSPSTWTQHHTTDGYVYYVHDATGESSWVLPEGDALSASSHCATLECHQSSAVPDNSVATAHVCEPADYTAVVPVLQADMQGRLFYLYETTGDWHYAADADWVAGVDPSSGVTYFWNQVTYESSWYHPMRVVPAAAPASLTTFGHSPLPSSTCRARAAPVRVRSSRTTARSDSDSDTTCEDSDSGNSGDDEDEVLHELEGVDGAVVGLTLRQRVKWTKALVRRLSGSAVENAVAIASSELLFIVSVHVFPCCSSRALLCCRALIQHRVPCVTYSWKSDARSSSCQIQSCEHGN